MNNNDYYMNPISGTVQSHKEWMKEKAEMSPEEWGKGNLIPVVKDKNGNWIEYE